MKKKIKILRQYVKKHKKYILCLSMTLCLFLWFIGGYIYTWFKFIPPHFHANFAMYIHGERVDFSKDQYQEDVAGCSLSGLLYPKDRVHLHENNPDTIHIHDEWVSWGHFFANNSFLFGRDVLVIDTGEIFKENIVKSWKDTDHTYILNGERIENPFNTLIKSEDRLLITYGNDSDEVIQQQYDSVSQNAGEYNHKYDPGSCGGTNENAFLVLLHDIFSHKHK